MARQPTEARDSGFENQEVIQIHAAAGSSTAKCPECDAFISIDRELVIGRQLRCETCYAALEIVAISPLHLDYAFIAPLDRHQTPLLD